MKDTQKTKQELIKELIELRKKVGENEERQARIEEALRRSEDLYRTLVEAAPCAVTMMDVNGRVTFVSPQILSLYGVRSPDDVLGQSAFDYVAPKDRPRAKQCLEVDSLDEAIRNVEYTMARENGSRFIGEVSASAVKDARGQRTGFVVTTQDVTERRRAELEQRAWEAKVQRVQKLESLGVLAGGIAHAFNNLLTGVLGNADMAQRVVSPSSPAKDYLESIKESAGRAAELASQMLAYSGKSKFLVEPTDISETVRGMTHLLEASISKKAAIEYQLEDGLPHVEVDLSQLRAAIMNLVTNASESTGERGGRISIATGLVACDRGYLSSTAVDDNLNEGAYVYLDVSDTGCGMKAEVLSRVFDPFFTTKFAGRGLGLAAVLGIVRGHRGALSVNTEEGVGSTFRMLLPTCSSEVASKEEITETVADWRGTGTILVVDDEEAVRAITRDMLEALGFQVLLAKDGLEGVEAFARDRDKVRLVLLDLAMPLMGGEEAFRAIREIKPDAQVVLMTGFPEEEATARFADRELAGFLKKPFQLAVLSRLLRDLASSWS